MNLLDFIQKYNGVGNVGNTTENKGECVGLVMVWLQDQKLEHIWGHAFNLLVNANPKVYEVIKNTPIAVPEPGDIIVWTKGFNGTYGHTAIVVKGNVKTFEVFEQNNPLSSPCRLHTYPNYEYVDGWLHPISMATEVEKPVINVYTDQTLIPIGGGDGEVELQAVRSIINDLRKMNADKNNKIEELDAEVASFEQMLSACEKDLKLAQSKPIQTFTPVTNSFSHPLANFLLAIAKMLG